MPKIVDHDQYRKELLDKSFNLFAEKGYASITMREIAQGLDVSTGTLYHYFPSKQALFEQLVEWLSHKDVLLASEELAEKETLRERIEALGQLLVREEGDMIKLSSILFDFYQHQDREELHNSKLLQRVDERYMQAAAELLGITDPVITRFVLNFISGLITERLSGNQKFSLTEQMALLGKMLTAYLEQQAGIPNHQVRALKATKGEKKP